MQKSLTAGNPAKLILFFTFPLLIGNLFQQVYNLADTLIVGRTLGSDALAAVGSTGSIAFLIIGFAQGLTAGFSIVTAQHFGAQNEQGVRQSVLTSVMLSGAVTVLLTMLSVVFARPILELIQTPDAVIGMSYDYIIIIYWGIGASVLFNLLSNIIRALGDSMTPLIFLVIACLLNIVLDLLFIMVFHMGVGGAAWATVIAQVVSGVMCLLYMLKKFPILRFKKNEWRVGWGAVLSHLRVGLPMGFQSSIIAIGAIILQSAINSLGTTVMAAHTAAQKVDMVATQPMMSFGMTMATFSAQNYGAGQYHRIKKGVRQCALMSVGFSLLVGVMNITVGKYLVGLFLDQPTTELLGYAQTYLTINGALYFLLAMLFILRYTLQGLGKSFVPTVAGVMELFMRSFVAIVLAAPLGYTGVAFANPAAWLGSLIPLTIAYFFTMRSLRQPIVPQEHILAAAEDEEAADQA